MSHAIVLGAGMVGSVMAADLAADPDLLVTIADRSADALAAAERRGGGRVRGARVDLADAAAVKGLIEPADVVLGAAPSALGLGLLESVIAAGKPYCDISFMPEDPRVHDAAARAAGVTAVVDCGVAPGMSNLLAAAGVAALDVAHALEIYVGGLPRERRWPFEYKAGFAPGDVIEEYTRPLCLVEHGREVVRPALSEPELIDFDGVGTLEAFNTDGLRTLVDTLDVPFMKEKTLRYPGHIELMRVFRETGLFDTEPIDVPGGRVRPRDVISALMFPKWSYEPGEADLTVMRIMVHGERGGQPVRRRWDLLDRHDPETDTTSMARTTAFPCAIVARRLLDGTLDRPGVHPPELLGGDAVLVQGIIDDLAERGVRYVMSESADPGSPS